MPNDHDRRLALSRALIDCDLEINIFPTDILFEILVLAAADRRSYLAGVIAALRAVLGGTMTRALECCIYDAPIKRYLPPTAIAILAPPHNAHLMLALPLCETCCGSYGNSVALRRSVAAGIERRTPIEAAPVPKLRLVDGSF